MRNFARLLLKSCEALKVAMGEFRNFKNSKKLPALIVKVGDAEEEMDSLFFTAMHELYKESREDVLDIFVWDKLFQRMENTCLPCSPKNTSASAVGNGSTTSPKTGEGMVVPFLGTAAIVLALGAVICLRRIKSAAD